MTQNSTKDFYISYTSADRSWAEWIAWQLDSEGYSVVIMQDFQPGANFVEEMNKAILSAQRIIAVLSPDYLNSLYTQAEWQSAFAQDPTGKMGILVPVRVRPCEITGLLRTVIYIDLVGLDEQAARERLLSGVMRGSSHKRPLSPGFPTDNGESVPIFPKPAETSSQQKAPRRNERIVVGAIRRYIGSKQIERNATADRPIRRLQEDKLDFGVYVLALRDFIESPDTSTPLTIGIDGPWGTGKSSLMRMLQSELDPPSNFWHRLPSIWIWLKWFIPFFVTFPIWIFGKIVLWFGAIVGSTKAMWFEGMHAGLAYDPSVLDISLDILPRYARFWATISALHCFMTPRTHPTVWFNAWKFDQEEQLWAALALAAMDQIRQRYSVIGRIIFWIKLMLKRFSLTALWSVMMTIALPLIFGFIAWVYHSYEKQLPGLSLTVLMFHIPLGELLVWAGFIVTSFIQILKIAKDPFQIRVKDIFDKPNYKDKVGFLGDFESDFSRIVSLTTRSHFGWKQQKLVIFIDDLDRCDPPKAVDIIEGINLFLDSEGCVFVLGMDSMAVVASIETKYGEMFEKMRLENTGLVSPGRLFLDKIVQVPFHVPPKTGGSERLLDSLDIITNRQSNPLTIFLSKLEQNLSTEESVKMPPVSPSFPSKRDPQRDRAGYKHKDVLEALYEGASLLKKNPRQLKRFVNLFRLHVYIADVRGLFEEYSIGSEKVGLTLNRLAIWVAWSIRWTEIIKSLLEELQLSELRAYLLAVAQSVGKDGHWLQSEHLDHLLTYEELVNKTHRAQEKQGNSTSWWYHLPWQWWLLDVDFLICIKELECFWDEAQEGSIDWLQTILGMTRVTFPASMESVGKSSDNGTMDVSEDVKIVKESDSNGTRNVSKDEEAIEESKNGELTQSRFDGAQPQSLTSIQEVGSSPSSTGESSSDPDESQ
jgi:KAP family P-loop domain/TIR domain